MDLRPYIRSPEQLTAAKKLGAAGLLCYQPFIFDDSYEIGVGWEFIKSEFSGLIHWPDPPSELLKSPEFCRLLAAPDELDQFRAANQSLRVTYDGFVETICARLGDIGAMSFLDVGCNSGYLPLSFSRRGAKVAVGIDREDYGDAFDLLNQMLGTQASFRRACYDPSARAIPDTETFDVVVSMMVLCHLSDPLNFLAFLGRTARRALFLWTFVTQEKEMSIRYGDAGRYYKGASFPDCFDYETRLSTGLLRRSLELMGFTEIYQLPPIPGGLPAGHYLDKRPILALRPDVPGDPLPKPASRLQPPAPVGNPQPTLLGQLWSHNIISFRDHIYAVRHGLHVDWFDPALDNRTDIVIGSSIDEVCERVEWE